MHSPLFISLYVFAVVFMFLGGICLFLRMVGWIFGANRSNRSGHPAPEWQAPSANAHAEARGRQQPTFVPPPTPRTEAEYWQAEQHCFDHQQPAPLPPPRRERDDW